MKPIVHLSFPVNDLDEAIRFYAHAFGARVGRHTHNFADLFLFGAQVTLQQDRQNVPRPMPRSRHFGATLGWEDWEKAARQLVATTSVIEGPTVSYVGEPIEQIKLMVADPSGNLIELKAYRHPENVLGSLVSE